MSLQRERAEADIYLWCAAGGYVSMVSVAVWELLATVTRFVCRSALCGLYQFQSTLSLLGCGER